MSDALERARDEFLSEAEEIIESLGRDLLALDESLRQNAPDPERVNDIFRGVHTLKGLSSLFGATHLAALSHELETLLDGLRLGRIELDKRALDLLYAAAEVYQTLLVAQKSGVLPKQDDYETLLEELRGGKPAEPAAAELTQFDIDPAIFAVLTEYEEHRLRVNVQGGMKIFRLHLRFALTTIDGSLDHLKATAKPYGEIITYLPTGSGSDTDSIELDVLLASKRDLNDLVAVFHPLGANVTEVPRRTSPPPERPGSKPPAIAQRGHASLSPAPLAKAGEVRVAASVRSVSQTVRVDIQRLDQLMNIVSELGIVRTALERLSGRIAASTQNRAINAELVRLGRTFDRGLEAMQNGILEVRMVPLGQLFERLARVGRQLGRDLEKQFNLVITGAETEVDKLIVEELSDPLMHMMRNAIDHGIETSAARVAVQKPELGTIALNAFQRGSHVVIEIEDDGRGIDSDEVLQVALKRGHMSPEEARSTNRKDVLGMIFLPGMTTKTAVSELSGRGVGMDVVKTNISKLGGVIDLQSEIGIGTKFTITLPITLAIIRALIVETAGRVFAIPLANVREAVTLDPREVFALDNQEAMTLRGTTLRLCRLSKLLDLDPEGLCTPSKAYVVVTTAGNTRLGLVVDHLVGGQDVVIKALGSSLKNVRGFAGAAELGDQRLGLVLDTPAIIEEVSSADRQAAHRSNQARSAGN